MAPISTAGIKEFGRKSLCTVTMSSANIFAMQERWGSTGLDNWPGGLATSLTIGWVAWPTQLITQIHMLHITMDYKWTHNTPKATVLYSYKNLWLQCQQRQWICAKHWWATTEGKHSSQTNMMKPTAHVKLKCLYHTQLIWYLYF